MKKYILGAMILGITFVGFSFPKPTHAVTLDDLQKQVQGLIKDVSALKTKLVGQAITATDDTSSTAPACSKNVTFTRTLAVGATGDDVKALQNYLIKNGFLVGIADGSYGKMTIEAVMKLQTAKKIATVAPGTVDSLTINFLNHEVGDILVVKICTANCTFKEPGSANTITMSMYGKDCNVMLDNCINLGAEPGACTCADIQLFNGNPLKF